jgi:hypothetical protein
MYNYILLKMGYYIIPKNGCNCFTPHASQSQLISCGSSGSVYGVKEIGIPIFS